MAEFASKPASGRRFATFRIPGKLRAMATFRISRLLRGLARLVLRLGLAFVGFTLALVLAFRWLDPPTSAFMLQARAGGTLVEQSWLPLEAISPSLHLAVIAAEDQRFATHHGLDTRAISRAIEEHRAGGGLRGASTITQQTAKNLFLWPGRNFVRKGLEVWFAVLMETLWPKTRILEVYLNVAEFGRGVYGAGAASAVYFGKPAAAITAPEAALLAAVLPNPRGLSVADPGPYVRERQAWILKQMGQLGGDSYLDRLK